MKKRLLGLITALFAFVVLLPMGAYASDVYAILYEDGELVFQNGNTSDGRAVKATYEVDLTAVSTNPYDMSTAPWRDERESIRVVSFANKVSPASTAHWFRDCANLERVDNIQNLDTANVTDMKYMFSGCSGLATLDVSHFDTSKVTNMGGMFWQCGGLMALDVSRFDTSNVTDMSNMFQFCDKLTALDVSGFNTANVIYMNAMFMDCSGLTALDVSHFDTSNVTNMGFMFSGCSGLTALDVSHFDTSKVTNMDGMFASCGGLTALDVSRFDTVNVTNMWYMFSACSGLTTIDLSRFDTANVTDMREMFNYCPNLKIVYASDKFVTASVTASDRMFSNCTSLVGGAGSKYDASHIDKEYARIDTASAPGYFTAKGAAPVAYAISDAAPENGNLSVKFLNPGAATLAVWYFEASGKFVSAQLQNLQANAGTVSVAIPAGAKTARVVLLDSVSKPLCVARPATL